MSRTMIWRSRSITDEDDRLFLMNCDYTKKDGRLMLCAVRIEDRIEGIIDNFSQQCYAYAERTIRIIGS
jgi:hypothetical protein